MGSASDATATRDAYANHPPSAVNLFGLSINWRQKAVPQPLQALSGRGGWWNIVREPFLGAWQSNQEIKLDSVLVYSAVFACSTLIAGDIGKLTLRLVRKDEDGVWHETESPAFSPVIRKPNRYQVTQKFIEQWIVSKLIHGNTYVLKQRDQRGVVTAMYVLDPSRVTPLVATDGAVYYQLRRDDLSGLQQEEVTVPSSEIIHDTMVALYHPLMGVSPIYACGVAALQGLAIQGNSQKFFTNGSMPGGVLSAPGTISTETAARLKAYWEANYSGDNVGKVAVLGDGLKYETMTVAAVDAQLIDQLKWTGETVCSTYHVPPYMVGIGPPPPYANVEPLVQQYYSQCLQSLIVSLEAHLDHGLEVPKPLGYEFDINDLIWMDSATKTKSAGQAILSGLSPNEVRARYFALGPVPGGETPYLQEQNWPISILAAREVPARPPPTAPAQGAPPDEPDDDEEDAEEAAAVALLLTKAEAAGLLAA
jgi:HK97 family phage portal protein